MAPKIFNIGDQLICPWTDKATEKAYSWVWDIVHMGQVTLEDGREVPGMYLQSHYLTPFAIQFDHEENERATEPTFSGDYSYYTKNPDGSYKLEEVVVGQQIPAEKEYYHSAIKDTYWKYLQMGIQSLESQRNKTVVEFRFCGKRKMVECTASWGRSAKRIKEQSWIP